jgi:2-haloacid dehalogenase
LEALDEAGREAFVEAWSRLDPWPDVPTGLERLRERFVVATLSNGSVAMLVANARYAGLRWDTVLSSDMVQRYKPDPAVYRLAVRLFDAHPSDVMLCAAHNGDLTAAKAEGLRTAFVRRPTEWGPHQRADLGPEDHFDFAARDLVDLAAQLTV